MTGIIEGIRVISMGHVVGVPAAAVYLADWGAEVIKVEPLAGETWRKLRQPPRETDGNAAPKANTEISWTFQLFNRNKKGLAVDLKTEPGKEILYRLVGKSDVFMSNYDQAALTKLKMDYATLKRVNPGIVYGLLCGYGMAGPEKNKRGYDFAAAWARAGTMYLMGEPGGAPLPQRGGTMDRAASTNLLAGILAALLHRQMTGEGQMVEVSLYHTGVWSIASDIQAALTGKPPSDRYDRARVNNPLHNHYLAKDDKWIWLNMSQSELFWSDFCRAVERPELENDSRFNSVPAREENCEALIRLLDEIIASKTAAEWEKIFSERDFIFDRVASPAEVAVDPQAIANGFFADLRHPEVPGQVVTTPVTFHQNPASVRRPAPAIGEHTGEILPALGYSGADIERLRKQRVIL